MSANEAKNEGRTHEPNIRELTSQLDDLGQLTDTRFRYIEKLMDERDRLYKERADAAKEQTSTSFLASEKAIVKAEEAQREYNVRSNEFRGQLDDQAKTLMPRLEAQTLFGAYDDKLEDLKKRLEVLQDFRSGAVATTEVRHGILEQKNWGIGILVAIFFGGCSLLISVIGLVLMLRK